jgi:hypothetical protein
MSLKEEEEKNISSIIPYIDEDLNNLRNQYNVSRGGDKIESTIYDLANVINCCHKVLNYTPDLINYPDAK